MKKSIPLEKEFKVQLEVQKLDFYLKKNPDKAHEIALIFCEKFMNKAYRCKKLETEKNELKQKQVSSPSLPPFKARPHG